MTKIYFALLATLRRNFNVLRESIDNLDPVDTRTTSPIHRSMPTFIQLDTKLSIFKTGFKVVDLLAPYRCGGKIELFRGAGVESKVALVYGQMNEPSGARMRVVASQVSALLGRMPSAMGYQPTLSTEMGYLQERITSTKEGSIASIQAVYVPAADLTDSAPAMTFAHLDPTTVLLRGLAAKGIYPAVDHLDSTSTMFQPQIVDIIVILGPDELSEEERLTIARARKLECFSLLRSRELDGLPEQAFYVLGNIDEATAKAINLDVESKLKK
ncbi:hypothetical protein AMTRI_Chr07g26610 [Amborella trichopoda]